MNHFPGQLPLPFPPDRFYREPVSQLRAEYEAAPAHRVAAAHGRTPEAMRKHLSRLGIKKRRQS